jgi:hypothetical protein
MHGAQEGDAQGEAPANSEANPNRASTSGLPPAAVAAAIAVPIAVVAGLVVAAQFYRGSLVEPVSMGAIPAPQAESADCASLLDALPEKVGDFTHAQLADPAPAGAAAWQKFDSEPIKLRCGLDRPYEFVKGVGIQEVNGVQWFEVSGQDSGLDASTWYAVDRPVYVAVTLPDGSGTGPIQDLSNTIAATLPAQDIDPAELN